MSQKTKPKLLHFKKKTPVFKTSDVIPDLGPLKSRTSKAFKFFKQCPWDEWWEEFNYRREPNGELTYSTAYSFAKAKTKTPWHRDVVYRAIGTKPRFLRDFDRRNENRVKREVPYIGDWTAMRTKTLFYDDESLEKMRLIIAERLDGLEAGRSSAAVVLDYLAKFIKYENDVDSVFQNSPVQKDLPYQKMLKRVNDFYDVKQRSMQFILPLIDKYLACHGISTDGMNDLGRLVMTISNASARGVLQGVAAGHMFAADGTATAEVVDKMNRSILERCRLFKMALPAAVQPTVETAEAKTVEEGKK